MNFSQLKYIVAVEQARNFSRAAESCGVAQSTLSKEIQRLEKEFSIIIFDRTRQPVIPTMKGADLIEQAKIILENQQHFIEIAKKTENLPSGEFRLGIQNLLAPYLLPLFITNLSKKYKDLNIEILELSQKGMLRRFENEQLDSAIIIAPFIKSGFYENPLFKEDFVLYLNENNFLLEKEEVEWNSIPSGELILHETFRTHLLRSGEFLKSGNSDALRNTNYQNGSLETIRKIIDRNGGITLLPELSTLYMGARRLKLVRKIVNPVPSQMISLTSPRGFEKRRVTKVIKQEILESSPGKKGG